MAVDDEMLQLAREVQGCDVRLGLMPAGEARGADLRDELRRRRDEAARRLALLEAAGGWADEREEPDGDPPPAA
jgi:hypothetical protein